MGSEMCIRDSYVADAFNQMIRKIVISTGAVTNLAGYPGSTGSTDAAGTFARFKQPGAIAKVGTNLYVADADNHMIRKISLRGTVTAAVAMHNLDDDTNATVSLASSDTGEATVSPATLTFTEDNWNTAQTVTVTGVNDTDRDRHQDYKINLSGAQSWEYCANENGTCSFSGTKTVRYGRNGKYYYKDATGSIGCSNGVFGDPLGGTVKQCHYDKNTAYSSFETTLNLHNLDDDTDVTVALTSSDTTEATVNPATLTFTEGNWNTAQTVTLTGVDDNLSLIHI